MSVSHVSSTNGCGRGYGVGVLKLRVGESARVTMVSEHRCVVGTHWIGGRSYMCAGIEDGCPGCDAGPCRGLGYFLATTEFGEASRPVLVEMSFGAFMRLEDALPSDWCGEQVTFTRTGKKQPLSFTCEGKRDVWVVGLDSEWRLLAAVATLYKMPMVGRDEGVREWSARTVSARQRALYDALGSL